MKLRDADSKASWFVWDEELRVEKPALEEEVMPRVEEAFVASDATGREPRWPRIFPGL